MHFLLVLALAAMMIASGVAISTSRNIEDAEVVKMAASESGVVQSFVLASKMYVANTAYSGSGTDDLSWATIKATAGVPVGVAAANVPATWRVRRTASVWVVCANIRSELAAQNVLGKADLMPTGSNALISLNGTTQQFVLGVQDGNTKAALITLCA